MTMSDLSRRRRAPVTIDPRTAMGAVRLTVSDLDRSRAFYEQALGLARRRTRRRRGRAGRAPTAPRWSSCTGDSSAPRARPRAPPGCSTSPCWCPSRRDLAFALARLVGQRAGRSTAPPTTWSARRCTSPIRTATGSRSTATGRATSGAARRASCEMATLPLDLSGRRATSCRRADVDFKRRYRPARGSATCTYRSPSCARSRQFYAGVLGFDVMVRGYPAPCSSPPAATTTTSG